MTLDPVHIGTGGYRLGRVDNSIVREPGTKIPKIPGTSLHGAARSYAAQLYETPGAAGQNHDKIDNPDDNPVCYTFGYIKKFQSDNSDSSPSTSETSTPKPIPKNSKNGNNGDKDKIYSGVVNIFDAHVLLFPVHSMTGPVWVSTVERLDDADFEVTGLPNNWNTNQAVLTWNRTDPLNLGWLMVGVAGEVTVTPPSGSNWQDEQRWKAVKKIVLVKDALFSQIVNSNLEVRTSVAISPETGAAEEGALFTYEAIPRATFLTAEVVLDDYRGAYPSQTYLQSYKQKIEQDLAQNITEEQKVRLEKEKQKVEKILDHVNQLKVDSAKNWNSALDVLRDGLHMIEWLGVGGMGTRGFGRMAVIGKPVKVEIEDWFQQLHSSEQQSAQESSITAPKKAIAPTGEKS
jgi:CRISPR-associated protein Cmr4